MVTRVRYQWEEDLLDLLLTLRADGTDSATLSRRQAQAYEASEDLPPLKEMKVRLRDERSAKKP